MDYGDKFILHNPSDTGRNSLTLKQISLKESDTNNLDTTSKIQLFEKKDLYTPPITLEVNSSVNFYHNKNKYTFAQDGTDKSYLTITKTAGNYEISDAIADATTASYVVEEEDTITQGLGTINGENFEISGKDININGNSGLIADGKTNKNTVIKTNIYGASDNITIINGGNVTMKAADDEITAGNINETALTIDNSLFSAEAGEKTITIAGKINGLNTNTDNKIFLKGETVNIHKADNVNISAQANSTNICDVLNNTILNLDNGETNISDDRYLSSDRSNNVVVNGGTLNIINNKANNIELSSLTLNYDLDTAIDIDLKKLESDTFTFNNKMTWL